MTDKINKSKLGAELETTKIGQTRNRVNFTDHAIDRLLPNFFSAKTGNEKKRVKIFFDVSAKKDFTQNNWKGKNILLFGSEGFGLRTKTLMHSDFQFKVRINKNMESLNILNSVAVTVTI